MAEQQYHDNAAERGLLGYILNQPTVIGDVMGQVVAGDFYEPGHAAMFAAMVELHTTGHRPDYEAVRQQMGNDLKLVGGAGGLVAIQVDGSGSWRRSAQTVREWATRRALLAALAETRDEMSHGLDVGDVLERAQVRLASIDTPRQTVPTDLAPFDEALDQPTEQREPWAVPGLLRVGWRAIVVAGEGSGKSVLFRQFALLAAQGLHPLSFQPIPPVRTLLVDLENPLEAIAETAEPIRVEARRLAGTEYDAGRAWLWRRPGGVDLRSRRDRLDLDAVLEHVRPQLVCLGPLYKAYRVSSKENDEQAAGELQGVLDDLRTRYGFALLMEHHAPKGGPGYREMSPYGSSFWLRWPEFGLKLTRADSPEGSLDVGKWRGDRLKAAWPTRLDRGGRFPWTGRWPDGERF